MVNTDILEGLKAGLERGQSLKKSMMSFYNAGYSKAEIEEAARAVSQIPISVQPKPVAQEIPSKLGIKSQNQNQKSIAKVQPQLSVPKQPQIVQQKQIAPVISSQKVSNYESSPKKNSDKLIVIILVSVLVFLLGILATVFFFREEIMSLFGG